MGRYAGDLSKQKGYFVWHLVTKLEQICKNANSFYSTSEKRSPQSKQKNDQKCSFFGAEGPFLQGDGQFFKKVVASFKKFKYDD